jgi:hypothetical protein
VKYHKARAVGLSTYAASEIDIFGMKASDDGFSFLTGRYFRNAFFSGYDAADLASKFRDSRAAPAK